MLLLMITAKTEKSICAHLRVGVQYADPPCLHHLMYGVDLQAVQVALILSMF